MQSSSEEKSGEKDSPDDGDIPKHKPKGPGRKKKQVDEEETDVVPKKRPAADKNKKRKDDFQDVFRDFMKDDGNDDEENDEEENEGAGNKSTSAKGRRHEKKDVSKKGKSAKHAKDCMFSNRLSTH